MGWLSSNFRKRLPITVINTSGGATIDFNCTLEKDLDQFWELIDNDGEELRITLADGITLATYAVDDGSGGAFDATNKLGRIRVDGVATGSTANEALLFWLYYDTETTEGDGAGSVTITSAETGYIERGAPAWAIVTVRRPRTDTDRPPAIFHKDSTETYHVWLDLTEALERRSLPFANRYVYEEVRRVTYRVVNNASSEQAAMVDRAGVRFVEAIDEQNARRKRFYVRLPLTGGADDTNYTLQASIMTVIPPSNTTHRTIRTGAGIKVRDLVEP